MEYTPQKDMFNQRRHQILSMYNNVDQILKSHVDEEEEEKVELEKAEQEEIGDKDEEKEEKVEQEEIGDKDEEEEKEDEVEKAFSNLSSPLQ